MTKKQDKQVIQDEQDATDREAQDTTPDGITVEEAIARCERIAKVNPVHQNDLEEVITLLKGL